MPLEAMILCQDAEALKVLRRVCDELKIHSENATRPERARELLAKRRFDAVIVDCDDLAGGPEVLKALRHTPSNKRSLAFAVVNGKTSVRDSYDLGANFVLDKPLVFERVVRSFRAAHGLMMRERRRYYRNPLKEATVQLNLADGRQVRATLVNLSEGGMAFETKEKFILNTGVGVKFSLPRTANVIEAKAEVSWMRSDLIGVRFLHMQQKMQRDLEQWVAQQPESTRPAPVFINATVAVAAR